MKASCEIEYPPNLSIRLLVLFEHASCCALAAGLRTSISNRQLANWKLVLKGGDFFMFNLSDKKDNLYPRVFMAGAIAAIVLAGIGYLGTDIWLASTQWLIIAAILALFGIYFKLEK